MLPLRVITFKWQNGEICETSRTLQLNWNTINSYSMSCLAIGLFLSLSLSHTHHASKKSSKIEKKCMVDTKPCGRRDITGQAFELGFEGNVRNIPTSVDAASAAKISRLFAFVKNLLCSASLCAMCVRVFLWVGGGGSPHRQRATGLHYFPSHCRCKFDIFFCNIMHCFSGCRRLARIRL